MGVDTMIKAAVAKGAMKVAAFNRARPRAAAADHPFLTGIHAPMREELTLTNLPVAGRIPPELDGRYLRIGPNPLTPPNPATHHWFTGDGMIHGLRLKGGKALWYRNRWVRTDSVSNVLGEKWAPGPRRAEFQTVNTNIAGHAGATWAMVEASGFPVRFDEELNTVAHDPFGGSLTGSWSAHPHRDPATGEWHAICYEATDADTVRHVVVGIDGRVRRDERVRVKNGPSIHDCMITERFVIILDLPVTFSLKALLDGQSFPYRWNPAHRARAGLLPREGRGDEVIWCDVDPAFVFHPANAYERDDGVVVLDVCAHATMFADSDDGPDSTYCPFERWLIDPVRGVVTRTVIDADPQEFPRPNEDYVGRPYRYAYTMALPTGGDPQFQGATKLYKHDLSTGTRQEHDFGPNRLPGEFVFVARDPSGAEDDGWLMGLVIDRALETTDFVILDAQQFEGLPEAIVTLPHRVPPGFHGNWIPTAT